MKKRIAILSLALLAATAGLAGCGKETDSPDTTDTPVSTVDPKVQDMDIEEIKELVTADETQAPVSEESLSDLQKQINDMPETVAADMAENGLASLEELTTMVQYAKRQSADPCVNDEVSLEMARIGAYLEKAGAAIPEHPLTSFGAAIYEYVKQKTIYGLDGINAAYEALETIDSISDSLLSEDGSVQDVVAVFYEQIQE